MMNNIVLDSGIVSSQVVKNGNTITDSSKNWAEHVLRNRLIKIVSGLGVGQLAIILDNSSNTIIIRGGWSQGVGRGAGYEILGIDLTVLLGTGSGAVYVNSNTAVNNNSRRFETVRRMLAWALISVAINGQVFGTAVGQTFPLAAGGTAGLGRIDLSTLYFANQTAGLNGTVHILGVED